MCVWIPVLKVSINYLLISSLSIYVCVDSSIKAFINNLLISSLSIYVYVDSNNNFSQVLVKLLGIVFSVNSRVVWIPVTISRRF